MADDIITSVVAGLLIAAISAIAAGLWHQLKNLRSRTPTEDCTVLSPCFGTSLETTVPS